MTGTRGAGRHDQSDAALAVAVGRFDADALAELYRRHAGAVLGVANRVLAERSLAEDVLQEVFVRFWNDPETFNPDLGTLRSFLLARSHSRAVEIVRSEQARRRRQDRYGETAVDRTFDLEREVWEGFVRDEMRTALESLDPGQRRAIELAYYGGYSYREVAHLLDEPEGTVKSRIRAGLDRMSTALQEQGALG